MLLSIHDLMKSIYLENRFSPFTAKFARFITVIFIASISRFNVKQACFVEVKQSKFTKLADEL